MTGELECLRPVGFARALFQLRFYQLRLSQVQFAERFGVSVGALRDVEQGRVSPSRALSVLFEVIVLDPELAARAAILANDRAKSDRLAGLASARAREGCGEITETP